MLLATVVSGLPCGASPDEVASAPGEYQRKTILYIPTALPEGKARLSKQDAFSYIVGIGSVLSNPRFHFYSLGEGVTKQFIHDAGGMAVQGPALVEAVNAALVPELTKILDARKLSLAQQYRTEADRESFVETKAKELGIDASLIEKAYEFSYVALPFLTDWKPGSQKENPYLAGGILWFRLEWTQTGLVAAYEERTFAESGKYVSFKKEGSFRKANESFKTNLAIALRERPDFQMASQILDVTGPVMHLTVGREDGVAVDDLYHVYEYVQENESTPPVKVRKGFVRISKLEKPEEGQLARSEARSVNVGRLSRGMMLQEIASSASEIEFSGLSLPYHISGGTLAGGQAVYMSVPDVDQRAHAAMIGYNQSLAWTGESQAYLGIRLLFGWTKMGATFFNNAYREDHTLIFGGDLGFEKRSFMGPIGLNVGIRYGLALFLNSTKDDTGQMPYKETEFSTVKAGPLASGGISFWMTPMYQLHVVGEKRWFGDRTDWKVKLDNAEKTIDPGVHPTIAFDSLALRVYLTRRMSRSLF
jgi:hypothetical protein